MNTTDWKSNNSKPMCQFRAPVRILNATQIVFLARGVTEHANRDPRVPSSRPAITAVEIALYAVERFRRRLTRGGVSFQPLQILLATLALLPGLICAPAAATNCADQPPPFSLPEPLKSPDNRVEDPGFDAPLAVDAREGGWHAFRWDGASRMAIDQTIRADNPAMKLTGLGRNKSAVFQNILLTPGRWRLAFTVAAWDLHPGLYKRTGLLHMNLPGHKPLELRLAEGDQGWTRGEALISLTEPIEATLYFFIYGPGSLWVDEVSITPLPDCDSRPDGATMAGQALEPLSFTPPAQPSDLVLAGYCDDPGMAARPFCKRLADTDLGQLTTKRADKPLPIADFNPARPIGDKSGFLDLGSAVELPSDWSGYDWLEVALDNPGAEPVDGYIEIRDKHSRGYWSRVNWYTHFLPGEQLVRIPLQVFVGEKSVIKQRRRLDTRAITRLFINVLHGGAAAVKSVQLSVEAPLAHDFPKLIKLDPGSDTSPLFHGFTPLISGRNYRPELGFGIAEGTRITRSNDRRHPDNLLRDWIGFRDGGLDIDLPDGRYGVWMMLEDPGYWEYMQNYDERRVLAEGQVVHAETMDAEGLFARLFAHQDVEDLPGDDIWQRYIRTRYKPIRFAVQVSDGQLNLRFDVGEYFTYANTLSALVIWPTEENKRAEAFLEGLWQRLRAQYQVEYRETPPAEPSHERPDAAITLFQRPLVQDVGHRDWPAPDERIDALSLSLAPGELANLTLSIYSRDADTLTDLSLDLPGIQSTAYSIRHKLRRATADGARYRMRPFLLDTLTTPLKLPADSARRLLFELQVAESTAPGLVQGELKLAFADGSTRTLPVTARISPVRLPDADIPIGYLGSVPMYPGSAFPEAVHAKRAQDIEPALTLVRRHGLTAFTGGIGGPEFSGYDKAGRPKIDYRDPDLVLDAAIGRFDFAPLGYGGLDPRGLGIEHHKPMATERRYGKPFDALLAEVLAAIQGHAMQRGQHEVVISIGDEPGPEAIDGMIALAEAIAAAGGTSAVFTSFLDAEAPQARLARHVDKLYLTEHNRWALEQILHRGATCGTYNLGDRYARGIYLYALKRLGCRGGYYQFAFDSSHVDPYYALDGREDDLVGALATAEPGKLTATLDLTRFGFAVTDYRWLLALERAIAIAPDSAAAGDAKHWLDNLIDAIPIDHAELAHPAYDDAKLDAIRREAEQRTIEILALQEPCDLPDAADAAPCQEAPEGH